MYRLRNCILNERKRKHYVLISFKRPKCHTRTNRRLNLKIILIIDIKRNLEICSAKNRVTVIYCQMAQHYHSQKFYIQIGTSITLSSHTNSNLYHKLILHNKVFMTLEVVHFFLQSISNVFS